MPAVNQLELHPRYASPKLQATAKELGVVLTGCATTLRPLRFLLPWRPLTRVRGRWHGQLRGDREEPGDQGHRGSSRSAPVPPFYGSSFASFAPAEGGAAGVSGKSPVQVVLRWTIQSGVVAIPRSGNAEHIAENADCIEWSLSDEDMAAISALDEAHPYYWDPLPCLAPGTSSEEL